MANRKKTKISLIVGGVILILLAIQIYRVDIYRESWSGPVAIPSTYAALDENGKVLTYSFLDGNKVLITMGYGDDECVLLGKYNGTFGNQFFDFLWKTDVEDWYWAQKFTFVEKGYKPVALTLDVDKGLGDQCLGMPRPGKTYYKYMETDEKHMKIEDKIFIRFSDPTVSGMDIENLLTLLE